MSLYQKYNAITRLCIYLIVLSLLLSAPAIWWQIPTVIIIIIIVLVHLNMTSDKSTITPTSILMETVNNNKTDSETNYIEAGYYDNNKELTFATDFAKIKKKQNVECLQKIIR